MFFFSPRMQVFFFSGGGGERSTIHSPSSVLSSLPRGIRHIQSTTAFRTALKTHPFKSHLYWSDYRKSLPGQFIRIRLKIEQNCHLFWDIFSSAIMNDTSRLKVDAKYVYQH